MLKIAKHPFLPAALTVMAIVMFSCNRGGGGGGGDEEEAEPGVDATVVSDKDGVITLKLVASNPELQNARASEDSESEDAVFRFPNGSLSADLVVTIEDGASMLAGSAVKELGLSEDLSESGPSVLIRPEEDTSLKAPIQAEIPFQAQASSAEDTFPNLFIIYKTAHGEGQFELGVLDRSALTVEEGMVKFETSGLGSFQAILGPTAQPASSITTSEGLFSKVEATGIPERLVNFKASTGSKHGTIDLTWAYPTSGAKSARIEIRRNLEIYAPSTFCDDGEVVFEQTAPFVDTSLTDKTGSDTGQEASYRACMYSLLGAVQNEDTVLKIPTKDSTAPTAVDAFFGSTGDEHAEIELSIDYPASVADYASVIIYRQKGGSAPDCGSGTNIFESTSSFKDLTVSDIVDSDSGERFSYRLCVQDAVGNKGSSSAVTNVAAKDLKGPDELDGVTVAASTVSDEAIDLTLDYPSDVTDYDRIEIRMDQSTTAPADTCDTDDLVKTISSGFTNGVVTIEDSDASFSKGFDYAFRLCIYDEEGNLQADSPTGTAKPSEFFHPIFVSRDTVDGDWGSAGGLTDADSHCTTIAQASIDADSTVADNLVGPWKAILSNTTFNARDRLSFTYPIYLVDGTTKVADDEADLWDGSIDAGISKDEYGNAPAGGDVYTGSYSNGNRHADHYTNWTRTGNFMHGVAGSTTGDWLQHASVSEADHKRIYCIGRQ